MTEQVFAREMNAGQWQWQLLGDSTDEQEQHYLTGDSEALVASLPQSNTPINLAVRGQEVISTALQLDAKQLKHAAKLIPFELEDEVSGNVDELHFAYKNTEAEQFSVLYTEQENCAAPIDELGQQGAEVHVALPDYLMLSRPDGGITFLLEAGVVYARLSDHWGFAIEHTLAQMVITRLAKHSAFQSDAPEFIALIGEDEQALEALSAMMPSLWQSIPSSTHIGSFWQALDAQALPGGLNLRSGRFARQLPIGRWWRLWRTPVIFAALAFVVALVMNIGFYYSAKAKEKVVLSRINEVYLDAVPNGRLGDVEGILSSKIKSLGSTDSKEPSNLVYLLSKVTEAIAASDAVQLTNFSYNGETRVLQLTIEVDSLSRVSDVRSSLTKLGIATESPRTTALGDGYQARIRVSEAK